MWDTQASLKRRAVSERYSGNAEVACRPKTVSKSSS